MPAQNNFFKPVTLLDPDLDNDVGPLAHSHSLLHSRDLPTLSGFFITTNLFQHLYTRHLHSVIASATNHLDLLHPNSFKKAYQQIKNKLTHLPQDQIFSQLSQQYSRHIGKSYCLIQFDPVITGKHITPFLPINPIVTRGDSNFIEAVIEALLSPFSAEALYYLTKHQLNISNVIPAVSVFKLPYIQSSGYVFTKAANDIDKQTHTIEAVWGLPQVLLSGDVNPTTYVFNFFDKQIKSVQIGDQSHQLIPSFNATKEKKLTYKNKEPLNNQEVEQLSLYATKIHQIMFMPTQTFWVKTDHGFKFIFSKPQSVNKISAPATNLDQLNIIASGTPISPGITSGKIHFFTSSDSIEVTKDKILVVDKLSPKLLPYISHAKAIITETGSLVSHPAVLARELSVPIVSNIKNTKTLLKSSKDITVNAQTGDIYQGSVKSAREYLIKPPSRPKTTATKSFIYINSADSLSSLHRLNSDGIAVVDPYFLFQDLPHPKHIQSSNQKTQFLKQLVSSLHQLSVNFGDRPVFYQLSHFTNTQYLALQNSSDYETDFKNPMLGFRGASRHLADLMTLSLELEALKLTRTNQYSRNLHLTIPFCRSPHELLQLKRQLAKHDLKRSNNFEIWFDLQLPANIYQLDQFINLGVDGIAVGIDTLTMLTLAIDPSHQENTHILDYNHPAITKSLTNILKTTLKHKLKTIIYSSNSLPQELVYVALNHGVYGLATTPSQLDSFKNIIYQAEYHQIH